MSDAQHLNIVSLGRHTWISSVFTGTTTKITQWNLVHCSGYTLPWQNSRLTLVRRKTLIYRRPCPHDGLSPTQLMLLTSFNYKSQLVFHCAPDLLFMHVNALHDTLKDKAGRILICSEELSSAVFKWLILYTLWLLGPHIHNTDIHLKYKT